MLSSLNLGSIDNLEKLPINSLNSICERVRLALLHVYLPKLCEKCQPAFSETFKKTQSNPILLKVLCDPCKLSYIRDKRSVSRKKVKPEKPAEVQNLSNLEGSEENASVPKNPAKRKQKTEASRNSTIKVENAVKTISNLKLKIKLLSATSSESFSPSNSLLSPPNSDELGDEVTVLVDNSIEKSHQVNQTADINCEDHQGEEKNSQNPISIPSRQIYEILSEKSIDWCRYCGVGGDTGTFWKLGPWGDRTLCHKHGCEFFGCGFARVTRTRLDLTKFYGEKRSERRQPIISDFCAICWTAKEGNEDGFLNCHSCPLGFHESCLNGQSHFASSKIEDCGFFFCSSNCSQNFESLTIRPQFPSKFAFPFYRQILTLDLENNSDSSMLTIPSRSETPAATSAVSSKLLLNIKRPNSAEPQIGVKKRKYQRKARQNENQFDRVIAFLPVKVDQSIHLHEIIHTPHWTKRSLQERLANLESACIDLEIDAFESHEELDETKLLDRHARYEHVEKTTRLLKPGVLQQLIAGEI